MTRDTGQPSAVPPGGVALPAATRSHPVAARAVPGRGAAADLPAGRADAVPRSSWPATAGSLPSAGTLQPLAERDVDAVAGAAPVSVDPTPPGDVWLQLAGRTGAPAGGHGNPPHAPRSSRTPERSRRHQRRTAAVLTVSLVLLLGVGFVVWTVFWPRSGGVSVSDYPGPGSGAVTVTVNAGDNGTAIAATLTAAGVVATEHAFVTAYNQNPSAQSIQPGTYNLLKQMKASEAVSALLDLTNRSSIKVTIPEGLTAVQILQKVSEKTAVPLADLQAAAKDTTAIGLPAQAGGVLEGWLSASTYQFDPRATATQMLTAMVANTVSVLNAKKVPTDQWESVLVTASIIEREAKRDQDRPMMATVIANRLAAGMKLQLDSTVAYGANKYAMDLTSADFNDASNAYNTYQHAGLPPGPIDSPSGTSIDAVLNPTPGTWLYWCTVNLDTGETKFATTAAEHQLNVEEYQAWKAAHATASATPAP